MKAPGVIPADPNRLSRSYRGLQLYRRAVPPLDISKKQLGLVSTRSSMDSDVGRNSTLHSLDETRLGALAAVNFALPLL